MGLITKFKVNKILNFLKEKKFSINHGNIIDGNVVMLPHMKWVFIQSNDHPHLFQLDLAVAYKRNYDNVSSNFSSYYVSLIYPELYQIRNGNELGGYFYVDVISHNNSSFLLDFCENVIASDEYTLEDLKNIIKMVSDEINAVIYDDSENVDCINKVMKNLEDVKLFSDEEIKQFIKKGHRNYMDKKREN